MQPKEVIAEKSKQNKGDIHQLSLSTFRIPHRGGVAISDIAISVPACIAIMSLFLPLYLALS
jgi:hypothetical protein